MTLAIAWLAFDALFVLAMVRRGRIRDAAKQRRLCEEQRPRQRDADWLRTFLPAAQVNHIHGHRMPGNMG